MSVSHGKQAETFFRVRTVRVCVVGWPPQTAPNGKTSLETNGFQVRANYTTGRATYVPQRTRAPNGICCASRPLWCDATAASATHRAVRRKDTHTRSHTMRRSFLGVDRRIRSPAAVPIHRMCVCVCVIMYCTRTRAPRHTFQMLAQN